MVVAEQFEKANETISNMAKQLAVMKEAYQRLSDEYTVGVDLLGDIIL